MKIFSSVWLDCKNYIRKQFLVFGNILKMLFSYKIFTLSQPFSHLPTKFYIRKSTTSHTLAPTDNLPLSTQNPPPKRHHPHHHNNNNKIRDQRDQADRRESDWRESRSVTIQVRVCEWRTIENRASRRP